MGGGGGMCREDADWSERGRGGSDSFTKVPSPALFFLMLFLHNTCRAYFECSAMLSKPRFNPCCSHPEMSYKRIGRRAVVVMNAILPLPPRPQLVGISHMVCAVLFKISLAFLFFYF